MQDGRSTSVTPALEVTVNFMAHSPNCIMDAVGNQLEKGPLLQKKPAPKGVFDSEAVVNARARTTVPERKSALTALDTVNRHKGRRPEKRPPFLHYLEFRLSITFAWFRYSRRFFSSATTVSMVTRGTPFSKSRGSKTALRFASVPIRV